MPQSHCNTKQRHFKHLCLSQRGQIQALLDSGLPKTQIARRLGISRSTLYRELERGTVRQLSSQLVAFDKYFADTGQAVYLKRRSASRKPYKLTQAYDFITHLETQILEHKLSVDAICGRCKRLASFPCVVSTKTVYNYISLGLLRVKNIDLPLRVKRKCKTKRIRQRRRILGTGIEQRPEEANERRQFGHWEIDTVVGKRQKGAVLLTLDERMTRMRHVVKIEGRTKEAVEKGLKRILSGYGKIAGKVFRSITSDNGSEFAGLEEAGEGVQIYYAHPYASGERGTNEKQNSLIRRFIAKGKEIGNIADEAIQRIEDWINELPRKMFAYRTPRELFEEQLAMLHFSI